MANSLVANVIVTEDLVTDAQVAENPDMAATYKITVIGNARDHDAVCAAIALWHTVNELHALLASVEGSFTSEQRDRYNDGVHNATVSLDAMIVRQMASMMVGGGDTVAQLLASLVRQ